MLLATVIALSLSASVVQAMTIVQFDKMSTDDQAEYVADLIVGSEKVLTSVSHGDKAAVVDIKHGDTVSAGMAEFQVNVAKAGLV